MVDATKDMLEIEEILFDDSINKKGTTNEIFDKISAQISTLVHKSSPISRPVYEE